MSFCLCGYMCLYVFMNCWSILTWGNLFTKFLFWWMDQLGLKIITPPSSSPAMSHLGIYAFHCIALAWHFFPTLARMENKQLCPNSMLRPCIGTCGSSCDLETGAVFETVFLVMHTHVPGNSLFL